METSEMELKVKVMYGDDVIIHCNGNDLVKHLKEILEEKTGIPVDHQRLIFMGRVLNNEKTLEECNVKDRCVLSLVKITPKPPVTEEQTQNTPQSTQVPNNEGNDFANVINPLVQSITGALGSILNGANANVQVNTIYPQQQQTPSTSNSQNTTTSTSVDDLLEEVLDQATNPTQQPNQATPADSTQQSSSTPSVTQNLIDSINASSQQLLYDNSNDETERAVLAYIIHLQQLAMNLQKRLRETNFNTTAWKKVQDSLRQHVQLTQSLIRLPSPAQNRLEPQRVDVIATSIPVAITRGGQAFNPMNLQNLFMQNQNQNQNQNGGNSNNNSNGGNGNRNNTNNQSSNDDYNSMYM